MPLILDNNPKELFQGAFPKVPAQVGKILRPEHSPFMLMMACGATHRKRTRFRVATNAYPRKHTRFRQKAKNKFQGRSRHSTMTMHNRINMPLILFGQICGFEDAVMHLATNWSNNKAQWQLDEGKSRLAVGFSSKELLTHSAAPYRALTLFLDLIEWLTCTTASVHKVVIRMGSINFPKGILVRYHLVVCTIVCRHRYVGVRYCSQVYLPCWVCPETL